MLYGHDLGIYVIPSLKDMNSTHYFFFFHKLYLTNNIVWNAVIFIRNGLYADGKFKFTVIFPKEFPKVKPIVKFLFPIYHPLIDPANGNLDLNVIINTIFFFNL